MKNGIKKLKTGLYIVPVLQVLVMALTIFVAFYVAVNIYVARLAEQNIDQRFEVLDAYYHNAAYDGYYEENADFIITVYHMVFDEEGQLLHPGEPWTSETEKLRTEEIAACYGSAALKLERQGQRLRLGEKTWYLMQRRYVGVFDGAFVLEQAGGETYTVLAYMNITPIADFLRMLTHVLLILITVFSLVTVVLLLSAGRRLDRSFQTIRNYILHVGERKELSPPQILPYAEFNEITDTVFQMSEMIEAAEAAQMKFFQNASHELRTPLTAIRGYAEGLHAGVIRDTKASAAIIMQHSDKMSVLVDDLLYTSKMDTVWEAGHKEVFDLREIVDRCGAAVAGKAANTGLRLVVHIGEEPVSMMGSEEMLERALSNILTNALRYAKESVLLSLTAGDEQAVITVEDDGAGIAPEDLPHIFQRFYKGPGGVTGIGLSITQEAVHLHGGQVAVSSEPGRTVFTVSLPLKKE